jgi:hypothetical protein
MAMTPATRIFVAYYVARKQRQSVFSGKGQDKAWDRVCEQLFPLTKPTRAVALAFPDARVLTGLTEAERANLLVRAYMDLKSMAVTMDMLWQVLGANRDTMIVARGMNSSDWNAVAGAWNSIRAQWMALLYACGMQADLDNFCPGKAMRLMAADVAQWHRAMGNDEGPDVKIFKRLPLPWDVVLGKSTCTRTMIEAAAREAGVSPVQSWTRPRETGPAVETKPTMALVHGVAVSDPVLADVLRRAGWFSAKGARPVEVDVNVRRDEQGFALGVDA